MKSSSIQIISESANVIMLNKCPAVTLGVWQCMFSELLVDGFNLIILVPSCNKFGNDNFSFRGLFYFTCKIYNPLGNLSWTGIFQIISNRSIVGLK